MPVHVLEKSTVSEERKLEEALNKPSAKTWEGLSRMAFAANWDPEQAINWDQKIELGGVREGWINILHYFYEGEWQGLEIIERLMNKAAHIYNIPEMVTYYSTQCFDEAKHLYVFRRYLEKLKSPPSKQKAFDPLVWLATTGPMPIERWIFGTYFTETMAGAIFQRTLELPAIDPLGKEMIRWQLKDESRHIAGTKLGVQTMMDHAGPIKSWLLRQWFKLFVHLAVKEVRNLKPYGDQVGMDPEYILRKCFSKMAEMPEFKRKFLDFSLAQAFLKTA